MDGQPSLLDVPSQKTISDSNTESVFEMYTSQLKQPTSYLAGADLLCLLPWRRRLEQPYTEARMKLLPGHDGSHEAPILVVSITRLR